MPNESAVRAAALAQAVARAGPPHVPLAVVTRGDGIDAVHYGSVAVVDRDGHPLRRGRPALPHDDAQRAEAVPGDAVRRGRRRRALRLHEGAGGAALREPFGRAAPLDAVAAMLAAAGNTAAELQCGTHAPGYLRRARRGAAAAAVFAARAQLLRQAQRHARVLRPVRPAEGELPRVRPSAAAGDPARGRPLHRDPGGEPGRGHRRLLGAQLRGAAGVPRARLRAARRGRRRPRVRASARDPRRRDDRAPGNGLGRTAATTSR